MRTATANRLKLLAMLIIIVPIVILLALSYFVTSETSDTLRAHYERVQVGLPIDQTANTFLLDEMDITPRSSKDDPIILIAERDEGWLPGARIGVTLDDSNKISGKKIVHPGVISICKHWLERLGF